MMLILLISSKKSEEENGLWTCSEEHGDRTKKCTKCLEDRAEEVKGMTGRRKKKLKMSVDDFLELGKAYFWFLDTIDPFTGMYC